MKDADDNEIAADLRVVISRLVKILRSEIKSDDLLSLTERSTLSLVYQHSKILPSELAAIEKVTNQSMSQIINKLLKYNYVKKTPSSADKRKVIVTITTAGKKRIENKRHQTQEWLARSILKKLHKRKREPWRMQLKY